MANWWSWLTGGGSRNASSTLGGGAAVDDPFTAPKVISSDFGHTSPHANGDNPNGLHGSARPAPHTAVLLDDPTGTGPEIAEIKPMGPNSPGHGISGLLGVVVPRNKQELIEELRKNYAEVIELVRKVNGHLDEQSKRQAVQDRRAEQAIQLTQTVATLTENLSHTLTAIQQQNARLVDILARLHVGQGEVRDALLMQSKQSSEAAGQLVGTLDALRQTADDSRQSSTKIGDVLDGMRTIAEHTRDGQRDTNQSLVTLSSAMTAVQTSSERLVALAQNTEDRAAERGESMAKLMAQSRSWGIFAGLCAAGCMAAAVAIVIVLVNK